MALESNSKYLELITKYHSNPDNFVFFVGAGLSRPLFPSWKELLSQLLNSAAQTGLPFDKKELEQLIEQGSDYLDIAETCRNCLSPEAYRSIMEQVFDQDFEYSQVPEPYRLLMELAPKTIVTTNYDRIPDVAGRGQYRTWTNKNAPEAGRAYADSKRLVFKMHGDINDHTSLVLGNSDYQRVIHKNQETQGLLKTLLTSKTAIFLGFSFTDPHIDLILSHLNSNSNGIPIGHYVLLNESSHFQCQKLENRYGIKVISYTPETPSHEEICQLLRALNSKAQASSLAPQQKETLNRIQSPDELMSHTKNFLASTFQSTPHSVYLIDRTLHMTFSPVGETTSEIQEELLAIIKSFKFETKLFDNISISPMFNNIENLSIADSFRSFIRVDLPYKLAFQYATKNISTSSLWKNISFFSPSSVTDTFDKAQKGDFPLHSRIIGD